MGKFVSKMCWGAQRFMLLIDNVSSCKVLKTSKKPSLYYCVCLDVGESLVGDMMLLRNCVQGTNLMTSLLAVSRPLHCYKKRGTYE